MTRSSALLAAASLLLVLPAAAQVRPVPQQVTVSTQGLALPADAARTALYARIDHAVTAVCGSLHTRSTSELQNRLACARQARADARTQAESVIAEAESHRQLARQMPARAAQ